MKIPTLLAALVLMSCGPRPVTPEEPKQKTSPPLFEIVGSQESDGLLLWKVRDLRTGEHFLIYKVYGSATGGISQIPNSKEMP